MENNTANSVLADLKERFGKAFNNKERTVKEALDLAYADMSRRAQNHRGTNKSSSIGYLLEEGSPFLEVINGEKTFKDQKEFDDWHQGICETLKKRMTGNLFEGTIGKAQKVINMAFKYLMYTDKPCTELHDYCHMTLDSYTLTWYKRVTGKKGSYTWSQIDNYNEYLLIQEEIRSYLSDNPAYSVDIAELGKFAIERLPEQPIQAEFIVWKGETLSKKYNELVKSINSYKKSGITEDAWLIGEKFSQFLKNIN